MSTTLDFIGMSAHRAFGEWIKSSFRERLPPIELVIS